MSKQSLQDISKISSQQEVDNLGDSLDDASLNSVLTSEWNQKGYVLLKNALSSEKVEEINTAISSFRGNLDETKDEFGFGNRIGMIHQTVEACREIPFLPPVQNFLKWAFQDNPLLFGSLTFETGTQQAEHIDSIFFHTQPVHAMAGVWVALEDVHPNAGPLFYIDGSHNWHFIRGEEVVNNSPDLAERVNRARAGQLPEEEVSTLVNELGGRWTSMMKGEISKRRARKVPALINKGDIFIWDALLIHGGSPRLNPSLSRKSMVFHFIGENCRLFHKNDFFLKKNNEFATIPGLKHIISEYQGCKFIKYDFQTYVKNGKEITIDLKPSELQLESSQGTENNLESKDETTDLNKLDNSQTIASNNTADFNIQSLYNRYYYKYCFGGPEYRYGEKNFEDFFDGITKGIIKGLNPKTVLDVGCGIGFLVKKLREAGVEAFGFDVSEYGISQVPSNIKPYCWVSSATDNLTQNYDLIVCMEVLEHMTLNEPLKAIENMCGATDKILFSSTPFDYREATHFNVHPPEFWTQHFAQYCFFRDLDFDASFVIPWAILYRKNNLNNIDQVIKNYERKLWLLTQENSELRSSLIELGKQQS